MSESLPESSLLALIRLYDELKARVDYLEDQVIQMQGDEDTPTRYMDGTPIK